MASGGSDSSYEFYEFDFDRILNDPSPMYRARFNSTIYF